jgi:thymidylate kinase
MGKLVAVEGPDKVGKTTLLQHLGMQVRERGFTLRQFRFPPDERSREVDQLYDVFRHAEDPMERQLGLVQMFNAYTPRILAALREHDIVLIDRYILSTLIACKALDMDLKLVNEALRSAIVPPDLTIIYTGRPFHTPTNETAEERAFHEEVTRLFEAEIPEYRHPVIRVTNEAAQTGKFTLLVTHLVDQILGRLRMPLQKAPSGST